MYQKICSAFLLMASVGLLVSCEKNEESMPVIPPSEGANMQLNGGAGGSSAANTVYVDLSAARQDSVKRASWDLAFSAGTEFRVLINNTTSALAKATTKSNLADVTAADTAGMVLALSQAEPNEAEFAMLDDIDGNLNNTVIASVNANEADNKVYILNPGTGGGTPARDWYKIKINRKGNGYSVQYARIGETNFQTIDVTKDNRYNFNYVSLATGPVTVEPEKENWDFSWGYSVFKTNFGGGFVPYGFSDLVAINYLGGVQAAEVLTTTLGYDEYNEASIATTTFSNNKWAIGSSWRATTGASVGVKTDRFYVIKDARGNVYKLKFISFTTQDGGTRGKPEISFKLVRAA